MSTEQAFERDPGRPQGPLPWWEALELQNLLDAEDALAAAGHPVDPEPWMLTEWELDDSPSALPVRAPRLDDDLLRLVGEEPEQRGPELPGAEDGLPPADEELPSPTAAVADLHAEAADLLVARLERLDREDGARAGERVVALGALARALGAASDDPLLRRDAPSIVASLVSATLKVSARTAKGMVTEALELNTPAWRPLLDAMRRGVLPQRRVRAVLDAALPVPEEKLTRFLAEAIAIAAPTLPDGAPDLDRIPAPGALRRRLRRAADKHASEPLALRKAAARESRRVEIEPAGDAMCWLTAYLPLEAAAAIDNLLESTARSLQGVGEARTLPQLRADVLADLLTARSDPDRGRSTPGGTRAHIIATIPARTLQGISEEPGEILGYGQIDPNAARLLAAQAATWTRMWVDPFTGAPLAVGRTRYTPTAAMRRQLGARDMTCRFPGCDKPAGATEADHTNAWANGGETSVANLALLCREHHRLKSEGYWRAGQIGPPPADALTPDCRQVAVAKAPPIGSRDQGSRTPEHPHGTIEWTSPTGRRYITYPEGDPPPPF